MSINDQLVEKKSTLAGAINQQLEENFDIQFTIINYQSTIQFKISYF